MLADHYEGITYCILPVTCQYRDEMKISENSRFLQSENRLQFVR